MVKIGVGLCFYNDLESLKRSIPSYVEHVDYIFAIDGRFSLLEGDDYSKQEVQDYVKSFPNVIYEQFIGMEHDKRQRYVDLARQYEVDYLLIIDSDDYIIKEEADWDLFFKSAEERIKQYPEENFFALDLLYTPPGFIPREYTPLPRLWVRPNECEYYKAHCIFKGKNKNAVRASATVPKVLGLSFAHDDLCRNDDYLNKVSKYQQHMLDYELPIRHALRDNKVF